MARSKIPINERRTAQEKIQTKAKCQYLEVLKGEKKEKYGKEI